MPRSGTGRPEKSPKPPRRFNEAGAIMPRSGAPLVGWTAARMAGFNEAGAIMPRSGALQAIAKVC